MFKGHIVEVFNGKEWDGEGLRRATRRRKGGVGSPQGKKKCSSGTKEEGLCLVPMGEAEANSGKETREAEVRQGTEETVICGRE